MEASGHQGLDHRRPPQQVDRCPLPDVANPGGRRQARRAVPTDRGHEFTGIQVRPICFIDGTADFCEVVFDNVFVPDELVLGVIGEGWVQNATELVFERGGPDRFLSTFLVLQEFLRICVIGNQGDDLLEMFGSNLAHYSVLHALSLSVARAIDEGRSPGAEAALVKELGTRFEQDVVNAVLRHIDFEPDPEAGGLFERLLVSATLTGPSFTIRGGTNEILRSIVARGLRPEARTQ